jgi:hypothetical protein
MLNTDPHGISRTAFEQLCRDASMTLGLADTGALGSGQPVVLDGVLLELKREGGHDRFVLLAELGPAADDHKAEIYEHLFLLQMIGWAQPGLRFGFNADHQILVMCLEAGCGPGAHGTWLASVIRGMVAQVERMRRTVLTGDTGPRGVGDTAHPFQAAAEKFVAVYEASLVAAPAQGHTATHSQGA